MLYFCPVLIKIGKFQQILIKEPNVKCYEYLRGWSRMIHTAGQTSRS